MNQTFPAIETLDKERSGIFKFVKVDCFKKYCISTQI